MPTKRTRQEVFDAHEAHMPTKLTKHTRQEVVDAHRVLEARLFAMQDNAFQAQLSEILDWPLAEQPLPKRLRKSEKMWGHQ